MYKTYSASGIKYLHTKVNELLVVAAVTKGYAFGGYVRDVVTQVLRHDFSEVSVRDVDIWFPSSKCKEQFLVNPLTQKVLVKSDNRGGGSMGVDNVYAEVFALKDEYGDHLIDVDLVVSSKPPCDDFHENSLVYDPKTNTLSSMFPSCSVSVILSNIRDQCVIITDEHLGKLQNTANNSMLRIRCFQRIVSKNWDIYSEDGVRLKLKLFDGELEVNMLSIQPQVTGNLTWRFICESQ